MTPRDRRVYKGSRAFNRERIEVAVFIPVHVGSLGRV